MLGGHCKTIHARSDLKDEFADLRGQFKLLHDRINRQTMLLLTGFIITIASVVITRLLS